MKRSFGFREITGFVLCVSLLFTAFSLTVKAGENVFDNKISERMLLEISEKLTRELKTELGDNSAVVKINNVEEQKRTENLIDLKGSAFCVLPADNNRLPIEFEAKIDARMEKVEDVSFKFVADDSPQFVPTTTEEVLIKELMKKVGSDYKTDEIVLAIDDFELISEANGREFQGIGEIKIGEVEWSKIRFDVVLDEYNSATKVEYRIE